MGAELAGAPETGAELTGELTVVEVVVVVVKPVVVEKLEVVVVKSQDGELLTVGECVGLLDMEGLEVTVGASVVQLS